MRTLPRKRQTVAWLVIALLACVLGAVGASRLERAPATAAAEILAAALLLAGLVRWAKMRGRLRLLAVLDAYAEGEIERARRLV